MCSGPFKFVERVPQDHVTLERFADYWDAKNIHFDKVVYQVFVDSSVRLANLKAGTSDLSEYIAPTDVAAVKTDPRLKLVVSDALGYSGITNNLDNGSRSNTPYGKNALVRQAFDAAIDRAALVDVVFNGMMAPSVQAVSQSSPFYDEALAPPQRDLAKAKALLKQAGVTPAGEARAADAEPAGHHATGRGHPVDDRRSGFRGPHPGDRVRILTAGLARGEYEAYVIGWSGRVDIDGNTYQFLYTGQGNNVSHYSNPTVDRLLDEGRGTTDTAKRRAAYQQLWPELRRDLPLTYLYNTRNIVAMIGKAERVPADPRRHDPGSGSGDGEVVRGHLGTRIAQIIPTLLLVSVLVFCLQQLMPGDPALVLAGEERGDPQVLAQIRAELWLDRSLPVQYVHWMGNVLQGNLGFSWRIRQPVAQLIFQKLPVTLQLGSMAFAIAVLIGVPAGIIAAVYRNGVLGLRRQCGGTGRTVHADVLARHHADPAGVGRSRLAAAVGLCAADRGLASSRSPPRSCRPSCWAMRSRRS